MSIRKIVIPVAGYGTRFLPFTKSIPKEMLPIVDRPVIQYIVEEAVEAGIDQIILITGYSKRAIEDYFDYNLELEYLLDKSGKTEQKELIRRISDIAHFVYVRQKEQLGNGHAILQAKELIGDEPFAVVWGDEFFSGQVSRLQQLIDTYNQYSSPVIFSIPMPDDSSYDRFGCPKVRQDMGDNVLRVDGVVEKPGKEKAPSSFASLGGYIFTPEIFELLENQAPGKGGEIWLVDAINELAIKRPVFARVGENITYYDCGNKLEYLKACVHFGLERPDINSEFRAYLEGLLNSPKTK